ncbi:glycine-rich RNA-binding protein [Spatholobus suberectus]|nr:glycine-rich RNA-binding protein [Spatholobus suberectus]
MSCVFLNCYGGLFIWADARTWFERQRQEEEMRRIEAENRAAMQAAEDLHRKQVAQEREGKKEEVIEIRDDPMQRLKQRQKCLISCLATSKANFNIVLQQKEFYVDEANYIL